MSDYTYTLDGDNATITEYTGAGGYITIPSTIDGHPVVSIGYHAFYSLSTIITVIISDGIISIGGGAFQLCSSLVEITIPNSITSISNLVLANCTSLRNVFFGNGGITAISDSLFSYDESLNNIVLPSTITSIGIGSFYGCSELTEIIVPSGVTTVGNGAFSNCTSLLSAIFLGNSPTIGVNVFENAAPGFLVYYQAGTSGWSNPWSIYEYSTQEIGLPINYITELSCNPGDQNEFSTSAIWVIDNYTPGEWDGEEGNLVAFFSSTSGSQVTISLSAIGNINPVSYMSFQDINFIGGSVSADYHCEDLGNNSGIVFLSVPESNFYADIDDAYTGTSHTGTIGDPFSWDDLNTHSSNTSAGMTYNIKGIHNDTFACGAYVSIMANIWQGWNPSVNGPWRIKSIDHASGTSINLAALYGSKIKGGIFYAPDEYASLVIGQGDYYSCIFIADDNIYVPIYDNVNFYGCSLYGTFTGYNSCQEIDFYNSCIDMFGYTGPGYLYNCAIADSQVGNSISVDCQINWSMPARPQWDGASSVFKNSVLSAGITTPPEPGLLPYTDYEVGLWDSARTGIGAFYFDSITPPSATNFYADIDDDYTGTGHAGTEIDPFSWTDLYNHSTTYTSGNTYNIKGIRTDDETQCGVFLSVSNNTWQGWDLSANGPWRIKATLTSISNVGDDVDCTVKDAILNVDREGEGTSTIYLAGQFYNCMFITDVIYVTVLSNFYGCSLYGIMQVSELSCNEADFFDCILSTLYYGENGVYLKNCALSASGYMADNQWGWDLVSAPAFSGTSGDYSWITLAAGITTPPQPGYGSPEYEGYETGLFGEPRLGIGAMWFGEIPIEHTPIDVKRFRENRKLNLVKFLPGIFEGGELSQFVQFLEDFLNTLFEGDANLSISASDIPVTGTYKIGNITGTITPYTYSNPQNSNSVSTDTLNVEELKILNSTDDSGRISILEKIFRLSELKDVDLISSEHLPLFADNAGYEINVVKNEIGNIGESMGVRVLNPATSTIDIASYERFMLANLPNFYRIKGMQNSITLLLYSFGLTAEILQYWTTNYLDQNSGGKWLQVIQDDLSNVKSEYWITPHFGVRISLDESVNITTDINSTLPAIRCITSVTPINTVFRSLSGWVERDTSINVECQTRFTRYLRIESD